MKENNVYNTHLNIKFEHQQLIDIPQMISDCKDKWFNQSLTTVNDSVVRIGIVEGEYHWHKHDRDDEFFLVLKGKLFVDLENETYELNPMQGITISRGKLHRTRALQRTVMIMVESKDIQPTGD
jgi:mannose-6-phosphate isomerase-like protein (cupin superfamily)